MARRQQEFLMSLATMQLFVCTQDTSHVGTGGAHIVLNSSKKNADILRRAETRGEIQLEGFT